MVVGRGGTSDTNSWKRYKLLVDLKQSLMESGMVVAVARGGTSDTNSLKRYKLLVDLKQCLMESGMVVGRGGISDTNS